MRKNKELIDFKDLIYCDTEMKKDVVIFMSGKSFNVNISHINDEFKSELASCHVAIYDLVDDGVLNCKHGDNRRD